MDGNAQEVYSCSVPGCGTAGSADQMWNLDKRATEGKRVVVCAPCGKLARREKVRTFRLSETLERESAVRAKQGYFKSFAKAFNAKNKGKKPQLQTVG